MAVKSYKDKRGNVLWRISLTLRSKKNRQIKVQLKENGFVSEIDAIAAFKMMRDRAILELHKRENQGKTFLQALDAMEVATLNGEGIVRNLTAATVQDYVGPIRKHADDLMDVPLSQIRKSEIKKVLMKVEKEVSPIRAFKLKGFLSAVFQFVLDNDFDHTLLVDPTKGIGIDGLNRSAKRPDILTKDEIRLLLESARSLKVSWFYVWAFAVVTGMRTGELYALLWSDVDLENRLIAVTKSYSRAAKSKEPLKYPDGIKGTKTEEWRHIPISDELASLLVELRGITGHTANVLPRIKAWGHGGQAKYLKEFCVGIGIKPVVFHALRACFAVQLLQSGVPTVTVMAIGGWEDMKTMMRYVRMAGVDIKGATQNLNLLPAKDAIANVLRIRS